MMNFHRKPHTYVSHVQLKVQDLERSLDYYKNVIGFQVLRQTDQTADLTADGKSTLLSIEQPEDVIPKKGRTTGLYHFALLLPGRNDLAAIVRHFAQLRIPLGSADHLVSEALYLSDPDGNGIEIYRDRAPEEWSWKNGEVHMTTDPLDFRALLNETEEVEWKGLPTDTIMGHIHLHVAELQETNTFYSEGLGFEVVTRYGDQALFISTGKYHHHIGLNTWNGIGAPTPPENSVGLQSYVLQLPDEQTQDQIVHNLKKIGATVEEKEGVLLTTDPSGNRIILQS